MTVRVYEASLFSYFYKTYPFAVSFNDCTFRTPFARQVLKRRK